MSATQPGESNEWIPGKLAGGVNPHRINNSWVFCYKLNGKLKSKDFSCAKYGGTQRAKEAAESYRLAENKRKRLSKNDYRYIDANTLEVRLSKGYTMLCDANQLENVIRYTWFVSLDTSSAYALAHTAEKQIQGFHNLVLPPPAGFTIDHRNGTFIRPFVLDNRKQNLRVADPIMQANNVALRKNNRSGVNGVHNDKIKKRWVVSWIENGTRRSEDFSYGPKSRWTEDEAELAAIEFRRKLDEARGCNNGNRPCLNLTPNAKPRRNNKRKAETEEKQIEQPMSKRVTNTITEYFK